MLPERKIVLSAQYFVGMEFSPFDTIKITLGLIILCRRVDEFLKI